MTIETRITIVESSGSCFVNDSSNWRKVVLLLFHSWPFYIALQSFAYVTTAQLSCNVQNFVLITVLEFGCDGNKSSSCSNFDGKTSHWNGEAPEKMVKACRLMEPSHYLNQCWLTSVSSCGIHLRAISLEMLKMSILDMKLKITTGTLRLQPHLTGPDEWTYSTLAVKNLF